VGVQLWNEKVRKEREINLFLQHGGYLDTCKTQVVTLNGVSKTESSALTKNLVGEDMLFRPIGGLAGA